MKTILVIEDDAQSREMILECLEAKGFNAIAAENGLVGVQKAREQLPDLVICNIKIPSLDGYGVLTSLLKDPATAIIPFIFVTVRLTPDQFRQGMNLGADDYLIKPCTVEELLEAITAQLEKHAAFRQWYGVVLQGLPAPPPDHTAKLTFQQSIFPACPQLSKVFDFIEANYHLPIGLGDVAQAVDYSSAYLTDLVRRRTGQSVHRWITQRRMVAACSLLQETDQSI
ncbi:MAG: response regulator, partial [Stigonema ocellatum SAG 48.90 = DSM 106950]|nr:response regulator [Stigonema ocellatum SAG 48.90 = DSM 106950]